MRIRTPFLRRGVGALAAVAALAVLAGCGSSSPAASPSSTTAVATRDAESAGGPSAQTRMICAPEAQEDLAKTLGLEARAVSSPVWRAHVYSCDYRYSDGAFTLSVRQLGDHAAARAAYERLAMQLTRRLALQGLGEAATTTANGSIVVQKDDDVLLVDIRHLPERFGVPADTRANAAISIAATIMGCWTGA